MTAATTTQRPDSRWIGIALVALVCGLMVPAPPVAAATGPVLYAVTGEAGTTRETLFSVDPTDASMTHVLTLGNGSDGEEIAFHPPSGRLLHASGISLSKVLEWIDLDTLALTDIPRSGYDNTEIIGLTWDPATGAFFAADHGDDLVSTTPTGTASLIGPLSHSATGLAVSGGVLYSVARDDNQLRTLSKATGATLSSVPVTGGAFDGFTALTTEPGGQTLWGVAKIGMDRSLVTIDPGTGVATIIGTFPERVAGLAWVAGEGVSLDKAFEHDAVLPGDTVELGFTITNDTPIAASDITFTDDLDAMLPGTVALGLPAPACGGTLSGDHTITLTGGSLAASGSPGDSCAFSVTVQIPIAATTGTHTNTTSEVTAMIGGLSVTTDAATDDLTVHSVGLSKSFSGPTPAGGTPSLTFTLTTDSPGAVSDVSFTDDLDAVVPGLVATSFPTSTCGATLTGGSTITVSGATVPGGGFCVIVASLDVPDPTVSGSFLNTTSDVSVGGVAVADPATDTLVITPDPPPFSKAFAPDQISSGGTSTLTFTIDNTYGGGDADNLGFSDTLPAGVVIATPSGATTDCTGGTLTAPDSGSTITYTGGTVPATSTCTVDVDVTSTTAGTHDNTSGDLTSDFGNSGPATASLTVTATGGGGTSADLALTLSPETQEAGADGTAAVDVTVDNLGPNISVATVTITLPEGVTTSPAPADCTGDNVLTCELGAVLPDGSAGLTLHTVHTGGGTDEITAEVEGSRTDPDTANNTATAEVTVADDPDPDLDIIGRSVVVSQERFAPPSGFAGTAPGTASWAVIARVDVFADTLTGSALTSTAPLLFTTSEALDPRVDAELDRLLGGSGTVYLLGGESALSPAVADAVADGGYEVVRLAGPSRIETSVAIAEEVERLDGLGLLGPLASPPASPMVGVARAYGPADTPTAAWADSVSAGGWSAATGSPILLTGTDTLHPAVAEWLAAHGGGRDGVVLGGTGAVSDGAMEEVSGLVASVTRVFGEERAATAVAIAETLRGVASEGARGYLVVGGYAEDGWQYGLLASGPSADAGAPVLLTQRESAPPATLAAVTSCADSPVDLRRFGGVAQVSDEVMAELESADDQPCA